MVTYDSKRKATLTLSQWLSVQCALSDAFAYNMEHGYKTTAQDIRTIKDALQAMLGADLDKAAEQCSKSLNDGLDRVEKNLKLSA